jgi:hypothetical protein
MTRHRRALVESAWLLLVLACASGLFLARYHETTPIMASSDSYWYMRQAQEFAGADEPTATAEAAKQFCRDTNRVLVAERKLPTCTSWDTSETSPRYVEIFTSRPGYALTAAPFVAAFGAWTGMAIATFLLAMIAAVLFYLAVWLAMGHRAGGVIAVVVLFLTPAGHWMTRFLAEGSVVLGYAAALLGVTLAWRGRLRGIPILAAALLWLAVARSANGAALALTLVGTSLVALPGRSRRPPDSSSRWSRPVKGHLLTALAAGAMLIGWFAVSAWLRLPGLNSTIQDFATGHFKKPDVPHPISWLIRNNVEYWPHRAAEVLASPLPLIALLFAAIVLALAAGRPAWAWVVAGLNGLVLLVAHPALGEWDRLNMTIWLPVSAGLGYAAVAAVSRARAAAAPPISASVASPAVAGRSRELISMPVEATQS